MPKKKDDTETLIDTLVEDATPVKKCVSPLGCAALWVGLTALVFFVLVPMVGIRPDIDAKSEDTLFIMEMAALLVAGLCAIIAALSLSIPDDRPRYAEYTLLGVTVAIWVALVVSSILFSTQEELFSEIQRVNPGFSCARNVLMFGAIPALAAIYFIRKAAPTHYRLIAFTAILGAFSFGVFGCRMHYGDVSMYILIWQYSPAIIAAIIAILVAERLLRW